VPRLIVARLLLACAVLLAQQTALAHDFWHAAGAASQGDPKPAKGKSLCGLHDLLGTVLGVVSAAPPPADLLSLSDIGFIADPAHAAQRRALVAQSRGPPALS
jgi:hypothetical protein